MDTILNILESWESIRVLDIQVEWIVDRIIPKESITVLFGRGGIGKTWLMMDMARSIGCGIPYLGLQTTKAAVIFADFENPLAVLNTRTQKLGNAEGVFFWRANNPKAKAPRLDSKDWELYKRLPPGAVLVFDTLRAAQGRDENASDQMGMIMGRLKELRDMGFTVILLHHTSKGNDHAAKGSTAIADLADHILGMTLVKKKSDGTETIIDDDNDESAVYRFGVVGKSRFDLYQLYLSLNPDHGFELIPDPQEDTLKKMRDVLLVSGDISKTAYLDICKSKLDFGEKKLRRLFDLGLGRYWHVRRGNEKNRLIVTASPVLSDPLSCNITHMHFQQNKPERVSIPKFGSFAKDFCQTAKLLRRVRTNNILPI